MTGRTVWNNALAVLNYTNSDGNVSAQLNADLNKRSLVIVNQILADLQHVSDAPIVPLESMNDEIRLCAEAAPVMVYGVAMLVAQSESDGDNQQMMATLYNQSRNRLPRLGNRVRDTIPYPVG